MVSKSVYYKSKDGKISGWTRGQVKLMPGALSAEPMENSLKFKPVAGFTKSKVGPASEVGQQGRSEAKFKVKPEAGYAKFKPVAGFFTPQAVRYLYHNHKDKYRQLPRCGNCRARTHTTVECRRLKCQSCRRLVDSCKCRR
jgi:hypothetical protein